VARDLVPSMAILKVNWDEGRDYIENFVPFIAECIRTAPQPEVCLPELQSSVGKTFGFNIPQGALNTILRRAARRGYVERGEGIYRRNDEPLAKLDFSVLRNEVLRKYEALIAKLVDFCAARFSVEWSEDEAEAAFLRYLEEGCAVILAATVAGEQLPKPVGAHRSADYLVSSFIAEVERADPEGFAFLSTVVKGSMLAGVLLFPDLGGVERKFQETDVFLDTPFVIQALGLEGESTQAPRLELIRLLYQENANLRVFDHTLSEVRNVLSAGAHALRYYGQLKHAYGPAVQHFIDTGYSASDVELVIAKLEKSLQGLHIEVVPRPRHLKALTVDERKLEGVLQERVGYLRKDTLQHDLDSLTAIHRLRRGEAYLHIESCKAIFITTNHDMALASSEFFSQEYEGYQGSVVPHCLLDHIFTTMVWLKKPLAAADLPVKRMIAECYAAMNPPDGLWRKYLTEIERLRAKGDISDEDYGLLRLSAPARGALMDATLGEADAFTEGTVPQILERARAAARADAEVALEAETKARVEAEREAEWRVREARAEAQATIASFEAQRRAQEDRIRTLATSAGRWVARTVMAAGLLLLTVGTFLGLFLPRLPGGLLLPFAAAALVLVGVAGLANIVCGATLTSVKRMVDVAVSGWIERILKRLLGVSPVDQACSEEG
jgi:hypothetical protein